MGTAVLIVQQLGSLLASLEAGGYPLLFLAIGVAGFRRVWVWGYQLDAALKEIEEYKKALREADTDRERAASFILDQVERRERRRQ